AVTGPIRSSRELELRTDDGIHGPARRPGRRSGARARDWIVPTGDGDLVTIVQLGGEVQLTTRPAAVHPRSEAACQPEGIPNSRPDGEPVDARLSHGARYLDHQFRDR